MSNCRFAFVFRETKLCYTYVGSNYFKLVFLFAVKLLLPWKEISAAKISVSQDKSKPLFQSLKILDIYELNMHLIALFMYSYFSNNLPK